MEARAMIELSETSAALICGAMFLAPASLLSVAGLVAKRFGDAAATCGVVR
jgi:hypothetical protein